MQAFHKTLGRYVEIVPGQMYDTHWNYYDLTHGVTVIRQGIPNVDLFLQQELDNPVLPMEVLGGETFLNTSDDWRKIAITDVAAPSPISDVDNRPITPIDPNHTKIIFERRPLDGYKNFQQFKEINADLDLDWEQAKQSMKFGININESNTTAIAAALPGIGKQTAKKICDRKPDGGYKDFDHLKSICSDFHLDAEAWEKVRELVEF